MEEEIFIITLLSIACVTSLLVGLIVTIAKHERAKLAAASGEQNGSLTASELRGIIEAAVANATRPLQEQLDELDSLLRAAPKALPGARPALQDALDPLPDADEERVPAGRPRSRS